MEEEFEEDYWSHIDIEDVSGITRIIKGAWGPFVIDADPDHPFLVLLIDTDGYEWLVSINRTYQEALEAARQEAKTFGLTMLKSSFVAGHC